MADTRTERSRTGTWTLGVALVLWLLPTGGGAQLPGWETIHETESYDFMVSLESVSEIENPGDSVAPTVTGVHLSRMLVRYQQRARSALMREREARGAFTDRYEAYASSTDVFWVDCVRGRVSLRQSVDFDADGRVLERRDPTPQWRTPDGVPHAEAVVPMVRWLCRNRSNPPAVTAYGGPTGSTNR